MLCGLPLALSLMLTEAVRVPVAVGVKVTLMVQLPLAATELPQVFVWAKSPELVPASEMPLIVRVLLPMLVRVTFWAVLLVPTAWLVKVRLAGDSVTVELTPVPVRLTVWGLPVALSAMLTEAVRVPVAVGVKVTLMGQLAPAATGLPQL